MFDFKPGEKHIIDRDQLLILKLSADRINLSYYLNSYKDFPAFDNGNYRRNHEFMGFMEEVGTECGFHVGEQRFVAVHVFEQNWDWELEGLETQPWILFFQGCDDISYYRRFKTKDELLEEWATIRIFTATSSYYVCN